MPKKPRITTGLLHRDDTDAESAAAATATDDAHSPAWCYDQAHVDADIAGLSRDAAAESLMAQMKADGVPIERRIARLKAHFEERQGRKQSSP